MAVEVALNTPLAEALSNALPPKLSEFGWSTGGLDDSALGEYIILMLVNGKTQEQIAAELSNDLLALPPEDTGATEFAKWLFEQVDVLNNQLNGIPQLQQVQAIPAYQGELSSRNGRRSIETGGDADAVMGDAMDAVQNGTVPTGPKSMRTGPQNGNRRMIGQISKAMDRSSDAALHRVRPQQGTERINKHNRVPPKGPRIEQNRAPRMQPNVRPMSGPAGSMKSPTDAGPLAQMSPEQQMQLLHMAQQQAQMMSQLFLPNQQQMFMPGSPAFLNGAPPNQLPGRSLFERVEPHRQNGQYNNRNGSEFQSSKRPSGMTSDGSSGAVNGDISSSMEVESSQTNTKEPSPDTICRFNLKCTKKDCPFAHSSPEAPPGTTIDVSDRCPFGAACKNRKCVGRHPSPAQKLGYQTQQECKFFPNCTNPSCPFRHPSTTMPMCKYGADCKLEGCKFIHNKTMCKFNPCTNPNCVYKHAEGQSRGKFHDKVWVADGGEQGHVSDRKFVNDEMVDEELVVPDVKLEEIKAENRDQGSQSSSLAAEVVT